MGISICSLLLILTTSLPARANPAETRGYWKLAKIEHYPLNKTEIKSGDIGRVFFDVQDTDGRLECKYYRYSRPGKNADDVQEAGEAALGWNPPPPEAKPGDPWEGAYSVNILRADSYYAGSSDLFQQLKSRNFNAGKKTRHDLGITLDINVSSNIVSEIKPQGGAGYAQEIGATTRTGIRKKTNFTFPNRVSDYRYLVILLDADFSVFGGVEAASRFNYFYEWTGAPGGAPAASSKAAVDLSPTEAAPAVAKVFCLCDEAFKRFSQEELAALGFTKTCNIRKGHIEILADFEKALGTYDKNHAKEGKKAFVSAPGVGGLRAINWLGNEGGLMGKVTGGVAGKSLAQEFVFERPEDVDRDMKRPDLANPGTEPALFMAIMAESGKKGTPGRPRPLTMGEIFYLALEQRNGDAREAMLLAHNTLRSLARGSYEVGRINDPELTGVRRDDSFFDKYVEVIRADHAWVKDLRDKAGPVYHVFGTAFFEMQMQGDIGALPDLLSIYDLLAGADAEQATLKKDEEGSLSKTFSVLLDALIEQQYRPETAASRVANACEQYLRKWGEKPIDPEKFCFNVWAARIGAHIWERLGGSVLDGSRFAHEGEVGFNLAPPEIYKRVKPVVEVFRCPVSVSWEANGQSLVFDQEAEGVRGYLPGFILIPIYEPSSGSWGAISFDFSLRQHKMTCRATGNGGVRILRVDMGSQKAAAYSMTVAQGETYTMDVRPGAVNPDLIRGDGKVIAAKPIDLGPSSESPAAVVKLFDNGNVYAVEAGAPTHPTTISFDKPHKITLIQNYHWNSGRGAAPGEIWLIDARGQKYGPWKARGAPGSGGVPNAYWKVFPNATIGPGQYTIKDSDPSTWSKNSRTQGSGISYVEGT